MYTYTAFEGFEMLSTGGLEQVTLDVKRRLKAEPHARILIFSDSTGKQMDFDLSGTEKEVLERLKIFATRPVAASAGVGRPRLGVVAREISLLPSHWEWLNNEAGGASATIRQLIDEKMRVTSLGKDKIKKSQEVVYKFLSSLAGDLPHFEEAIRFLYRRDKKKFMDQMADWPRDVVSHTRILAADIFE